MTTTLIKALAEHLHGAGQYNHDDKVGPVAVLMPDPDKLWQPIVAALREHAEVLALGELRPEQGVGPAIWIRTELSARVDNPPTDSPIVVYLPGIRREDVRAIESCSADVRPIAELQFRSAWWVQSNMSVWTPSAFLGGRDGLALDVAKDVETRNALLGALVPLAATPVEDLERKGRLDAAYFSALVNPDEIRTLLQWLSDPQGTQQALAPPVWETFRQQVKSRFGMDPATDGPVAAAERLGLREGDWALAWQRFVDAPHSYPGIPDLLHKARPGDALIPTHPDSWPQENESAEAALKADLTALASATAKDARDAVLRLDSEHAGRRGTVWGVLQRAPLAAALEHLRGLALTAAEGVPSGDAKVLAAWYSDDGYRADDCAVRALATTSEQADRAIVAGVVRVIYREWLDDTARAFQDRLAGKPIGDLGLQVNPGDCVVFVDGLRMDVAHRLAGRMAETGLNASLGHRMAVFPTMTAAGKPAVAPLSTKLVGGKGFGAATSDGKSISQASILRDQLARAGVTPFGSTETGPTDTRGWTEAADLDATGHKLELKLVDRIPHEVDEIMQRVRDLLDAGWARVHVVTDHGFLLVPGGLLKVELPQHLTDAQTGRCARLSPNSGHVDQPVFPWALDSGVRMVSPRGAAAFENGVVYAHGGVSLQEVVVPHFLVTRATSTASAQIDQIKWVGFRCRVDVVAAPAGATVDVRTRPADASSSVASTPQSVEGDDDVKVLIEDDVYFGSDVFVVLLTAQGEILGQVSTKVGG